MEALPTYLLVFALGAVVGSLVNVVVYRLPSVAAANIRPNAAMGLSYLALPLSFCPHCGEGIKPWNNVPVASYLLLRGRSACCGRRISPRYLALELAGAMAAVACLARFGFTPAFLWASVFCWALLAACAIDADSLVLPDVLVQPLLWLGLLVNLRGTFVPLDQAVLGAALGFAVLFAVGEGTSSLLGKRMLGAGDPKLLAAIGAWVGWKVVPLALFVGAGSAVLFAVAAHALASARVRADTAVAFGPHLGIGALVAIMFGERAMGALLGG